MTFFTVSSSLLGTVFVVRVLGELDYRHAPAFRPEMEKAWEAGAPSMIVVDVTGLTFCDSTGVAELILALQRSRALGVRLALVGVHGTLERHPHHHRPAPLLRGLHLHRGGAAGGLISCCRCPAAPEGRR